MSYVAPIHKATSIRNAVRINLLDPNIEDLVLAKVNRLEVWRITEEGMTCLYAKLLHGTITMLQRMQPAGSETDLLFVGTDRMQYFDLAWNPETNELEDSGQRIDDASEPYMRQSQSQSKCLVDPTGKYVALHLWEGILNVFRLPTRKGARKRLEVLDQVRLTELWMKSSTFIHSRDGFPRIAFLYKTQIDQEEARLAIYRLTKDDKGGDVSNFNPYRDRELDVITSDPYASMLIPVPVEDGGKHYNSRNKESSKTHLGGILVVGETLLTYFDSESKKSVASALKEPKIFVAWTEYDSTHYFLADDYGRLDILTIETCSETTGIVVTGMKLEPMLFQDEIAITSRASNLVYMGDNKLFLASHHGNSQLFKIDLKTREMSLIKSLSNNAPIMDFAIMDMGNREGDSQAGNAFSSGQSRVVAGCGAYRDGCLRSIRSGVGLTDHGILEELEGTRGLFTMRSYNSDKVDTLLVSFITETRIFKFDLDGGIEEVYGYQGMTMDTETLLASALHDGRHVLQITPNSAKLLDPESGTTLSSWEPPEGRTITSASANDKWALLSIDGLTLVSLNLHHNFAAQVQDAQENAASGQTDQISCIHVSPDATDVGVVGWWLSGRISLVDMASLKPIHGESMRTTTDSATVPRDVMLVQLHPPQTAGPTLMVATEDGTLITFNVSASDFSVSGRKNVTLGSSPARLHILPQEDGTCSVFATTEHASLIYSAEGRIIYSATTADDATFVAPFDSHAFPDSIVLSTDNHVKLCHVDKERLTHVKVLPVGESVRRVAYSPDLRAFGLGCIKKELIGNEEVVVSSFRLVDEIIFKELGKPIILNASTSLEVAECVIRAELPDSGGQRVERFIVGTSFLGCNDPEQVGQDGGRILVLGVDENRQAYLIVSHVIKGPCRCLAMMGDVIVAGLSKTVVVYEYLEETSSSGSLEKLAMYRPTSYPVEVDVSGNMIGVIDLVQSVAVVEYIPRKDGEAAKLVEHARHYETGWSTSVCHLADDRWLGTDSLGNLIVLRHNMDAPIIQGHRRLEIMSEINLGEQINRVRKLHVAPTQDAIVTPRAFLGSTEGSLYLLGEISPEYQDLLMTLQSKLEDYVKTPGSIPFSYWRSFRSEGRDADAPYRFVDGEMVERFLDLDDNQQLLICEGLGPSVEALRNVLEDLRRLR